MAAVDVQTTSTLLFSDTNSSEAVEVIIQNRGPNSIYVSTEAGVTTATGVEVASNGVLVLQRPRGKIYAVAATANQTTPANTRVL